MDNQMFCYQCEQTLNGTGCIRAGVCGKDPRVAALQDLLIHQLKGIGYFGHRILQKGVDIENSIHGDVMESLFATLTNVNFDEARFENYLRNLDNIKKELREKADIGLGEKIPEFALYALPDDREKMVEDGRRYGILSNSDLDPDVRSLRELLIYGMKGMAAYGHHAYVLGQTNKEVYAFLYKGLAAAGDDSLGMQELLNLVMELGKVNLKCMEMLDAANTGTYGHPSPTSVLITRKKGPFIIVSGHDLRDLEQLLKQTEGKGINIYTHGEMLPAHAYPGLKKYKHLVGNYGGAWQDQQKEFDSIPGCILMTTNCLQKPRDSYRDRIFTTNMTGWTGVSHIEEKDGKKDFTPIIEKALELGGWTEDEPERKILVGFGRQATLSHAEEIISLVKSGKISHFFLVGGCDGAKPGRNYYTEFVEKAPKDTVILTLACGKYRFNKLDLGTVEGLPRLLDVGQCNDAYSAIRIALALADAFECGVNDLPLTLVLSWYEQKAVCILITLLSLGIKNIYLGPTLPAFLSPNVANFLVENFNIHPITTAEQDLKAILG